jgi:hypothetical protein
MSEQENVEIVKQFFTAFQRGVSVQVVTQLF